MSLHRRILLHSIPSSSNDPDHSSAPPPSRQLPCNVIIAVVSAAAACLFLAIIYYSVLHHRRRHRLSRPDPSPPGSFAAIHHPFDHPTWQVRAVGLDDAAISSLGSYSHCRTSGDLPADCPVCLGEILEGELVRHLPKCRHVFHVPCIDTWLRCHVTCPLCRAPAVDGCNGADSSPQLGATEQAGQGEGERDAAGVRVSVEVPESSRVLTSESMDEEVAAVGEEEKEGNCSCSSSKEEGLEKGQSEIGSGRGFVLSRLGRAKSSSTCSLTT